MSNKLLLVTLLYMALWASYCYADNDNTLKLSIDDLFILIDRNNTEVKAAKQSIEVSKQNERVARASRLPEVNASLNFNYLGDVAILDRDFSNGINADMPHLGNTFAIVAYQPIFTGGAISGGIKLSEAQSEMSQINYFQLLSSTRMKVIANYLNLFKNYNLLRVYNENIALNEALLSEMKARASQGIALKNDVTRYELRLSTLEYDQTTINNNIKTLNYNLTSYLGLNNSVVIVPDSSIMNLRLPLHDISTWKTLAIENSMAIKRVASECNIAIQKDRIVRSDMYPKIGLVAGNKLDGPITIEIPTINKNLNYWWVGIELSYNLSSLFKVTKDIKKSKLEISQLSTQYEATTENVDREIEEAYTHYLQAFELLKTQEKNVELATENYRVVSRRFDSQLALLTDMLDASTAKLDADVRLVNAYVNTIYYYYQLKFISGTL